MNKINTCNSLQGGHYNPSTFFLPPPTSPLHHTLVIEVLSVHRIRLRWIRNIFASWIRIQASKGQNINLILSKKLLLSKPKSELFFFVISKWFMKIKHKNRRKKKEKKLKILMFNKSVNHRECS